MVRQVVNPDESRVRLFRFRPPSIAGLLLAAIVASGAGDAFAATFANPIVEASPRSGSADPSVVRYHGYYYYCRSLDDGAIGVARARRLQDIGAAPMVVVFRPPAGSAYSRQLWAPELQRLRGRWYIYFAASDGMNAHHRMYALQALADDPQGAYAFKGRIADRDDRWAIDGAVLELGKRLYFVWSGWPGPSGDFPQLLYIAAMRDPLTIVGEGRPIALPDRDWEKKGAPLLEAPEPLRRNGRSFIVYSASASWGDDYALGLLAYIGGNPLRADAWVKARAPLFVKDAAAGVFSVGHPSFVRSPDGRQDWIVYHATDRSGAGWRARSVRAQPFGWDRNGRPSFGTPIVAGRAIEEPSGTPGLATAAQGHATISSSR